MKIKLLIVIILSLFTLYTKAQSPFEEVLAIDSQDYFQKIQILDSHYDSLPDSIRYDNNSGYKRYQRWKWFIGSRIDTTGYLDSFITTFLEVEKSISGVSYKTGDELEWCNGNFTANWKPLGFSEKPMDNGRGWRNGMGWIRSIWVNPTDPDKMFAGGNCGGLWRTLDGGNSWSIVQNNIFDGMGIQAIAVNPLDYNTIYVAPAIGPRGSGAGIWKTVNGGSSWFPVYGSNTAYIKDIEIHPLDTAIVLAIINNRVMRTKDGGNTPFILDEAWGVRTVYNALDTDNESEDKAGYKTYDWTEIDIEVDNTPNPPTSTIHVTGTRYHMRSTDNGNIYKCDENPHLSPDPETSFGHSSNPVTNWISQCKIAIRGNTKYKGYLLPQSNLMVIEKWNPSLTQWDVRKTVLFPKSYMAGDKSVFEISTLDDDILYIGGVNFFIYDDATQSFIYEAPSTNIHDDMRAMSVINIDANNELIVVANDGGVKKAIINKNSFTTVNWIDISKGLQVQQIHGLSLTNELPARVYTGHQDLGMIQFDGINKVWSQANLNAGDGGELLADPSDPTKLIWMIGSNPTLILTQKVPASLLNPNVWDVDFVFTNNRNLYYLGLYNGCYRLVKYIDPFSSSYNATTDEIISSYCFPTLQSALYVHPNEQTIYAASGIFLDGVTSAQFKFARSLDGGNTWEDASDFVSNWSTSPIKEMLTQTFITDIKGNPNDPDELYISFGFIPSGNPVNVRVMKTTNATSSSANTVVFSNWSEGLNVGNVQGIKSLPVTKLVYDELSDNHMVYAATDMGVYYRNDNTGNAWIRFSEGLPFALSSDLILDRNEHRLILATYGRGTWYTDIPCCSEEGASIPVETTTTWNTDRVLGGITIVPNGVTLTMEDATFWFKPGGQIIVQPGGHLIVNNALLTSYCTSFWGGIIVQGQAGLASNDVNQGFANITNSTIQYAYRGVFCGDENDFSKSGGIVFTENATFKDCRVGIAFFPYPSSGSLLATSKIRNSKFIGTEELPDKTGKGMLHGISLWSINGVRLEGNDYINSSPEEFNGQPVYYSDHFRGNGVLGIDASFVVDGRTASGVHCQLTPSKNSYFEGLSNGVVLLNSTNPNARNSVISSTFKNCQIGINAIDDVNSKFYKNNFSWDGNFVFDLSSPYGYQYQASPGGSPISESFYMGIFHNSSDGFLTEGNTVTYESDIDRNIKYNAFAFYDVHGSTGDFAVRNQVVNNVDASAVPQPLIIGKSLNDDCKDLIIGCNEYCNVPVDWYWINDNTGKVSDQTGNTNNFTDPGSSSNLYNVNYYLKSPGTGKIDVLPPLNQFAVSSNCSYTLPTTYNVTSSTINALIATTTTCLNNPTSNCAVYKTTQVLPGDSYDGSSNPWVDRVAPNRNDNEDKKKEIVTLINAGEHSKAKKKISLLDDDSDENIDFKKFYNLLIEEYEAGHDLHNISKNGLNSLRELGKNTTVSGAKARTILMGLYGEVISPENTKNSSTNPTKNNTNSPVTRNRFKLYPNPASSYFTLSYEIMESQLPSTVEVTTSLGVVLYSSPLTNANGTLTLLTDSWSDGVYYVNIKDKNSVLYKEKIVLIH